MKARLISAKKYGMNSLLFSNARVKTVNLVLRELTEDNWWLSTTYTHNPKRELDFRQCDFTWSDEVHPR